MNKMDELQQKLSDLLSDVLSNDDLKALLADCEREEEALKAKELEYMLELDALRRKQRTVSNERFYLQLLLDESTDSKNTKGDKNDSMDFDIRHISGTLTMRRNRLLMQSLKTAH